SSLVNRLCGRELLAVGDVRRDGKGRHTTTHRELAPLPGGGVLVDTPGLRGLALWNAGEGVERVFADVEETARECRFSDCRHEGEPGCAVNAAVAGGSLTAARGDDYRPLEPQQAWPRGRQEHRPPPAHPRPDPPRPP